MIFDDASSLLRTLTVGVLAYVGLVVLVRISGKRTLAKWNAFDFIVTVALGSSLASALLTEDVTLVQGLLAFALLVLLQLGVTWLSVRFEWVEKLVKASPVVLLDRGRLRLDAMLHERVTESEIHAALRRKGLGAIREATVILETDGSFSVIRPSEHQDGSTLEEVSGFGSEGE